jgi:tRNA (cytidine/uridine-2'-O-)-methyltransferase
MNNHNLKIVLVSPEIPWNTGAIGRTCVALGMELIVIKPTLIDFSDKTLKRAGLDYWQYVKLKFYENWDEFLAAEKPANDDLFFLSTKAKKLYYDAGYKQGAYLVFGAESKGLPQFYHETYTDRFFILPMYSEHIRSLNLANTATAVAYEALRQITCHDPL